MKVLSPIYFYCFPVEKKKEHSYRTWDWIQNCFQWYMYLIREDINRKVSFSFGLCPNYQNRPPPLTPILATLSSFLDAFILHLKDQKKNKFSMVVFTNRRGCKSHRNCAITQSKAVLLWQKSRRTAKVLISLKYLCGGLLWIQFLDFVFHHISFLFQQFMCQSHSSLKLKK